MKLHELKILSSFVVGYLIWWLILDFIMHCYFCLSSWHMDFCQHYHQMCYNFLCYPNTIILIFLAMMVTPHLGSSHIVSKIYYYIILLVFFCHRWYDVCASTTFWSCLGDNYLSLFVDTTPSIAFLRTTFFFYPTSLLVNLFPTCEFFNILF